MWGVFMVFLLCKYLYVCFYFLEVDVVFGVFFVSGFVMIWVRCLVKSDWKRIFFFVFLG